MPNGTYGGVRGKETKVGQKTFVSRPTRLYGSTVPIGSSHFIKIVKGGGMLNFFCNFDRET